jgi:hypothetical protein
MAEPIEETDDDNGGLSITRYAIIVAGGLVIVIALIFIAGLGLAIFADPETTVPRVGLIRDIFIIILSLEAILIILALTGLILQVARLIGLLQTEIKPILKNTQETVETAKGTAQFVSRNVVRPIIGLSGFLVGLRAFLREIGGIRRAIRKERTGEGNG